MLRASLERFRLIRERTLNQVKVLSQEQVDFSPPSGEWSIGEILDHLRLGERVFRKDFADLIDLAKAGKTPSIYRSFAEMNAAPAFIPQCVLPFLEPPLFVMNRFIPNNIRVSLARANLVAIRHPDVTTPSKGKSADTLRAELCASLRETESLFAANPALDYNAMTHEYPMLGIQTVPQLLDFLGIEESLHQGQIDRVIAEPRFPKAG